MSLPAVVLIITHKDRLDPSEEMSLRQCVRVLGRHPISLVCPVGMDASRYLAIAPQLTVDPIPSWWLSTYENFARLKVLPFLYRRYARFEYILFYELDAYVFRDDLAEWCGSGWDYLGAPWFEGYDQAKPEAQPAGAGNGGFSLRRTVAMLGVSRTWRYRKPAGELMAEWRQGRRRLRSLVASLTWRNNFFGPCNDYWGREDFYWCDLAARRFPNLRVAPYEVARRFSFEVNPARLYRECGETLPFGCHKWTRYEPEFWQEHMSEGRSGNTEKLRS